MSGIPDTADFRKLILSLKVSERVSELQVSCAVDAEVTPTGKRQGVSAMFLHYDEQPGATLKALRVKLTTALAAKSHPHDEAIVDALIATYAAHNEAFGTDPVLAFNRLLEAIVPVDVSHAIILPTHPYTFPKWEYFDYTYSSTDDSKLKHRCQRADCDFFTLYGKWIRDRACITSPIFSRSVVNFHPSIKLVYNYKLNEQQHRLLLGYYELLSKRYLTLMWDDLEEKQLLPSALGVPAVETHGFRNAIGLQNVTIYLNHDGDKSVGYVVPSLNSAMINTIDGNSDIVAKAKSAAVRDHEDIPEVVRQFCRFGVKGHLAFRQQNNPQAFIHYMISIELLLGSKENTTRSVSRRAAVVVGSTDASEFHSNRKAMEKLYGVRSKYVHAGELPSESDTEKLRDVFMRILEVVTITPPYSRSSETEKQHEEWLKMIDYVAAGFEVGQAPAPRIANQLGILSAEHAR